MVLQLNLHGRLFKVWLAREELECGLSLTTHKISYSVNNSGPPTLEGYVVSFPDEKFSVNFQVDPLDAGVWVVVLVDARFFYSNIRASRYSTLQRVTFIHPQNELRERAELRFSNWPYGDNRLGKVELFILPENFKRPAFFLGQDESITSNLESEALAIFRFKYFPCAVMEVMEYVPGPIPIPLPDPVPEYYLPG